MLNGRLYFIIILYLYIFANSQKFGPEDMFGSAFQEIIHAKKSLFIVNPCITSEDVLLNAEENK